MTRPADPFSYLPLALPGVIVGLGLIAGSGGLFLKQWSPSDAASADSAHTAIRGHVERADWVASAADRGPSLYLRLRIDTDPRSFIVSERSLAAPGRNRIEGLERARAGSGSVIPALAGRSATVVVDSSLRKTPDSVSPYMSALRVDGTVLVPLGTRNVNTTPVWVRRVQLLSLGLGTLLGLVIFGASVQHLSVCLRYWREEA